MHMQTPSSTGVCIVALDIGSDPIVFSETVVVPGLAWDLTELLDGNIVGEDALALVLGTGGARLSSLFISTWRETSFATVS